MSDDDRWEIRFQLSALNRRVIEAQTTMSDGGVAWRGLPLGVNEPTGEVPLASGVFTDGPVPTLLDAPLATRVIGETRVSTTQQVTLDLLRGLVTSQVHLGDDVAATVTQFASAAHPGLHVAQADGPAMRADDIVSLLAPSGSGLATSERGAIASYAIRRGETTPASAGTSRLTATACHPADTDDVATTAIRRLRSAAERSTGELRAEHEAVWAKRWRLSANDLPDQPETERRLRFAQYHLLCASIDAEESTIGARGATGQAYGGHVFWDTDVFVVPALSAMAPKRARAALRYRFSRLDAAQDRARCEGRSGARFPWESADIGAEVAPTEGVDLHGQKVPIKTGTQEIHVTADIAWSVLRYLDWTADESFASGPALEILAATARYWQTRVEVDTDGTGHLRGVIGPDEYHETVNDNAFTNIMARWNLRQSADFCESRRAVDSAECGDWRMTADRLVDGFDEHREIHEQFAGFFALDPIMVSGLGTPPLAADVLLGRERISDAQVIKQADVLMLHHLIPSDLPQGSFETDLDFYLPRTAHGSSLSPAITAALLARADRLDQAQHWFEVALAMDLDDLSKTTAGGLHLATMGGAYQAFSQGFLGVVPTGGVLHVDPHLPLEWGTVTHRFLFRSLPVCIKASADRFTLSCPAPIEVAVGSNEMRRASTLRAVRHDHDWSIQ